MMALCCTSTQGVDTVDDTAFWQNGTSEVPTSLKDQGTFRQMFSATRQWSTAVSWASDRTPGSLFPKKWHRPSLEQSGENWRAWLEHLQLWYGTANISLFQVILAWKFFEFIFEVSWHQESITREGLPYIKCFRGFAFHHQKTLAKKYDCFLLK